jgi:hypothetical protein
MSLKREGTMSDAYNYAVFRCTRDQGDFDGFTGPPHVGERAPDGELTDLGGATVTLSSLWRVAHLVLEFGSYT